MRGATSRESEKWGNGGQTKKTVFFKFRHHISGTENIKYTYTTGPNPNGYGINDKTLNLGHFQDGKIRRSILTRCVVMAHVPQYTPRGPTVTPRTGNNVKGLFFNVHGKHVQSATNASCYYVTLTSVLWTYFSNFYVFQWKQS